MLNSTTEMKGDEPISAKQWSQRLNKYRNPSIARSIFELAVTVIPFAALWVATWIFTDAGIWYLLPILWVVAAGLLVRIFLIQHDCGHGSFFASKFVNDWVGRVLGVLTMSPYDSWRHAHAIHHAASGHLEHRGVGDIDTLTVEEYLARSARDKFTYRLYRHPIVMFGIGPTYQFLLRHRLPSGPLFKSWHGWSSTMITNLVLAGIITALVYLVGFWNFILIQLPITILAASIGVWLFYVQHQFEDTFWGDSDDWNRHEAALHGSSYYDLPSVLRWFTANIGVHHVHHLSCGIPYYRLHTVLQENPELKEVNRFTLWESFKCVRLVLWDAAQKKLISFKEVKEVQALAA